MLRLVLALALLAPGVAHAELLLVTRDGVLHHGVDGASGKLPVEKPRAVAVVHASPLVLAVAHEKGLLEVAGKQHVVPGNDDLVQLAAAGGKLYGLTRKNEVMEIDDASGKRTARGTWAHAGLLAGDTMPLGIHDGVVEVIGAPDKKWPITGHPIAAAATGERLFVATREGPLWQIDLATGRQRDLGLGGWWGTLAMAAQATHLYVATSSGKVWDIDYAAGTKTALAMDGWQGTVGIAMAP
jgi:hypothetical protein